MYTTFEFVSEAHYSKAGCMQDLANKINEVQEEYKNLNIVDIEKDFSVEESYAANDLYTLRAVVLCNNGMV